MKHVLILFALMLVSLSALYAADTLAKQSNVLFIAVDDLNDWIGCLGGHPQTKTPNFDRLAASGVLFKNAYCAGASCNPSRAAIMTGLPPHRSGLYNNRQKMREVLPDAELMPKYFSHNGYWSAGSGKILHYMIDPRSWDDYFPDKAMDNPFPRTFYPKNRPVNLPRAGEWQYDETDWAALDVTDEEFGGDWLVTKWIGEQLQRAQDKPFFLACGLYRPHEPWFVPKKYFEPFPLETTQPGPGYKVDDLEDVPPTGQKLGRNRYFEHIQKQDQWKKGIQAYLSSIHFADAMLGRVLDALEKSPQRDNTIVVLWSDHGWHLGEKEHWQKFTGWRICNRVPLIVRVPKGASGLPEGTRAGSVCDRPVSLVDLFRTLTDLCGLPDKSDIMGHSLVPLLRDPATPWPHAAMTHLDQPESYAISTEHWRYIHYKGGDEELYDIKSDPHEWTNLVPKTEHATKLAEMRALAPARMAPLAAAISRQTREVSGWQVHIQNKLLDSEPIDTESALVGLKKMLDEIVRDVPAPAVAELRKVPLYFSPAYKTGQSGAEFHPGADWLRDNGRDPGMVRGVEFSGVHDFQAEMKRMPNFALHELAHAYHHCVLKDGFDNLDIKAAYERVKATGKYERVERTRGDGKPNTFERAYAMTDPMEYFAETTEAFFSRNDFFPFTRAELKQHDPEMFALLAKLWGVAESQ